jgi:hypothetical protein
MFHWKISMADCFSYFYFWCGQISSHISAYAKFSQMKKFILNWCSTFIIL